MVISLLYKNTVVKIKKSFGRYISLFIIVMVGVGFFAGIQASAPDMIAVADHYYKDHKLMDFKVVSSMGLTNDDVNAIKALNNVSAVIPSYSLDVLNQDKVIRVHAIEDKVNTVKLIDGSLPKKDNECLADSKTYKIGDQIKITSDVSEKLKNNEFTVVGTIESVLYLADDYGNTTIGDGKLSSFIFIGRNNFILNAYTEIYIAAAGTKDTVAYSKDYDKAALKLNDELVKIKPDREKARYQELYTKYKENSSNVNASTANTQTKADDIKTSPLGIEKPQWHIFDRDAAVGYSELKTGIDVITSVAAVFPFFFILIVMLMTSNSMARMIAEERSELGTLTSLGYKDKSIIATYIFYVLSASGLGAIAGFFMGCGIIPPLIYSNFKFILPPIIIQYNMMTFSMILVVTLTLMTLVTIISCNKELKQKPAALIRPAPPQNGQTILLEKISPIWKHLSFTWKVTMRNMFRYKKRAFMTVVGVAGCTSLLLVGFGLRDSMNGVGEKQYGEIFRYGNMIILKDETRNISSELESLLTREKIKAPLLIKQNAFKCESSDKSLDAFLIVPENEDVFHKYYNLKSKATGSALTLNNSGVVITQKLSESLKANKGDTITVKDADNNNYQLTVSDVAENYMADYVYMNNALYSKVFGKSASYNAVVSNHNTDEKALAEHLIDSGLVLNVVFTGDIIQKALESNESLNSIIILIIVVASLLAIIVLYNLTSINISERTREIATLKVLGFTDGETNGYIYREAFILTIISIVVGLIMGIFLHGFVIDVIEGYAIFFKKIRLLSFILACLLTMIFSAIMQIVTYFKLRTIDMIESLKSVE